MNTFRMIPLYCAGLALMLSCNSGNTQQQETAATGEQPAAQEVVGDNAATAVLELETDTYDFGQVAEGTAVEHEFRFKNAGGAPLIISNVQASCGCTTPEYSKNPVAPGEEGMVKVVFNSAGQTGKQHKVITVTSNATTANTLLNLRGEVTN